jgi:hypothetical protein
MTSRTAFRALPYLALVLLPFGPGCFEDHTVGDDVPDAAGKDAGCPVAACGEPNVPVGCHLGEGSCVDGVYQCPEVICSDASTGCATNNMVCETPPIPSGCTLGPRTCVDGVYQCPAVVCPDGGAADAGQCIDIDVANYDTSCTTTSDCVEVTAGTFCSPICTCGGSTVNVSSKAAVQQALDQAEKTLGTAECGCPVILPPQCVGGKCVQSDGGSSFSCGTGSLTCDSTSQYCFVVAGGPISPDGGTSESAACDALPASCTGADATCACLQTVAAGTCTVTGSGITMQIDAP